MSKHPKVFFQGQEIRSLAVANNAQNLVSISRRPNGGRSYRFRCSTAGCSGTYNYQALVQNKLECEPCRRSKRTLFGVSFISPLVQKHKDRIKNIERVGDGNIYTVECATDDCVHTYRVNRLNRLENKKCIWCWRKGRRKNPKWTEHYRKICKIARDIGKTCTISFGQFRRLCEIPICFYCRDALDRQPYVEPGKKKNLAYRLDRMLPAGDYTLHNVVSCCWRCNNMKRDAFSARELALVWSLRRGDMSQAAAIIASTDSLFATAARRWCAKHESEPTDEPKWS